MNLTTQELEQAIAKAEVYYRQRPIQVQLRADLDKQQRREIQLSQSLICRSSDLNKLRDHLGSIEPSKIKQLLTQFFYDGSMMKVMFCVLESILSTQGQLADGGLSESDRVRHWLQANKQIGSESVFGYAISTGFDHQAGVLVAKAPRPGIKSSDSLHEYVVGAYGLNKLRDHIPNFAYVFGTFDCGSPVIGANKTIDTWCGYQPGVNYVLYENVTPSKSLGDLNQTIDFDEFLNYYVQILLALRLAHRELDFTHYDLHDQNVLIRMLKKPVSIKYDTPAGERLIETQAIATIIDYGQSHIKIDGTNYGYFGLEPYGPMADRSFPLFDAYKLLLMSMRTMYRYNNPTFDQVADLLKFFTYEDPVVVVEEQSKLYYSLPRTKQTLSRTLDQFIDFVLDRYPIVKRESQLPILKCYRQRCRSPRAALGWLNLSSEPVANDLIELYDLVVRFGEEGKVDQELALLNSYPFRQRVGDQLDQITVELTELSRQIADYRKPSPTSNQYRQAFDDFGLMVDRLHDIGLSLKAVDSLSRQYQDKANQERISDLIMAATGLYYDLEALGRKFYDDAVKVVSVDGKVKGWLYELFPIQIKELIKTLDNINL